MMNLKIIRFHNLLSQFIQFIQFPIRVLRAFFKFAADFHIIFKLCENLENLIREKIINDQYTNSVSNTPIILKCKRYSLPPKTNPAGWIKALRVVFVHGIFFGFFSLVF